VTVVRRGLLVWSLAFAVLGAAGPAGALRAQSADQKLAAQREELARVRRERESLEHEATVLSNTAHELSDEVSNLDRRVDASARIVATLEHQLTLIADEAKVVSDSMAETERNLAQKREILRERVVDVYKRGPLFTAEALLSARSFGELVARYKYLHDLTLRDRGLVAKVQELRDQLAGERDRVMTLQAQLQQNRDETAKEEERLKDLENQQTENLRVVRQQSRKANDKLELMKRTESDMISVLAAMEAAKKRNEANNPAAAPSSSAIRTSDYGTLDWPVDGPLVYTYGKQLTASNATIHWNGVGISAPEGTPVHCVADGTVIRVQRVGTYGLTIFVDHGGGDYTIYGSLDKASVADGDTVAKGQVIGTTGISDPDLPPHLHFEIRVGGRDAVNPVTWLKKHK
jgi:septal ring factor EnvC (AmiA/AmiB activator)